MKYTILESDNRKAIQRNNEDGSITIIPFIEGNADYEAYLRWLENPDAEEGGTL